MADTIKIYVPSDSGSLVTCTTPNTEVKYLDEMSQEEEEGES